MLKGTYTGPSHQQKQNMWLCHKTYLMHASKSHQKKYLPPQGPFRDLHNEQ